ncbi:hypothetical protein RK741_00510 [Streptococcus pneumoniae]|uniref:Uncharacterized protein n=1 Tax=Streptococcus pneumoniae TaxID=1313 RepID=A0AAQ2W0B3_STREE|nr:hypothetical protein [Streptococcus pneumoniae]MDS2460238.1 hypothetical protein [Streptococcus pneumoniae]MDS2848716.1 hypothetical protein [Streptococcus pneumoniae]MDS3390731.1 hypothetical protein [Streptococcus pneumoniae]MDS3394296.1 hypothetical protein [Streptococcus pneumoniae]MDS3703585.1 hypothetical protein [Streptococcus pneumoniae]
MNTLNEKAINIFKAVAKETLIQGTYEENFLYSQLETFSTNCRQFTFGWTELAEEIECQERYLLDSGFTQDEIDDIRFDAAFVGMQDKMNVA